MFKGHPVRESIRDDWKEVTLRTQIACMSSIPCLTGPVH